MKSPLENLAQSAQKLSKNPLGIIALFIIFIYAFASLVVGMASNLQPEQKNPLIWFLVLFPVLVLGVFAWLVSYHHKKLYAPSDYKDEKNFLETIRLQTPAEYLRKLDYELQEAQVMKLPITFKVTTEDGSVSNNIEQFHESIRKEGILAEELSLRKMESELKRYIVRNTIWASGSKPQVMLDGFSPSGAGNGEMMAFEVKYLKSLDFKSDIIKRALDIGERFVEEANARNIDAKMFLTLIALAPQM